MYKCNAFLEPFAAAAMLHLQFSMTLKRGLNASIAFKAAVATSLANKASPKQDAVAWAQTSDCISIAHGLPT